MNWIILQDWPIKQFNKAPISLFLRAALHYDNILTGAIRMVCSKLTPSSFLIGKTVEL